jgi:hypothetical protein
MNDAENPKTPANPRVFKTQQEIEAVIKAGNDNTGFKGGTFKCFADFSNKPFSTGIDFSGAIFEDGASFKNAVFQTHGQDVLFDETIFLPSENSVTFAKAQFDSGSRKVSFKKCHFKNGGAVDFSFTKFSNTGLVDFRSASFTNGRSVSFRSASFDNGRSVSFRFANFSNSGSVSFRSASFTNVGTIDFRSARFTNGGAVSYRSASFTNSVNVEFRSTSFANGGDVSYHYANFMNGGDVGFNFAIFTNGANVDFRNANFTNKKSFYFRQLIWANLGELLWNQVNFKETTVVKFEECLFLSGRTVLFNVAQFPKDGSLMFQRCYFAKTKKIDFTGTFFRHTIFEGGNISWLKGQKDRTLNAILKKKLKERFSHLPQKTRDKIDSLNIKTPEFSKVFAQGAIVLWKDLTTESAKNLTFRLTDLSGSIFDGMTLSHIQLNAPTWAEYNGRAILYEEKKLRDAGGKLKIEDLRNIGNQYTQLKNNMERQGNYLHAGSFHFSEQELRLERLEANRNERRKTREWPKFPDFKTKKLNSTQIKAYSKELWRVIATDTKSYFLSFLTRCYRFLSGYGERPARAVGVFVGVFALLWVGVGVFDGQEGAFKPFVEVSTPFSWAKPLVKGDPLIWKWHFLLLIPVQLFLIGVQLPLMILAVRRRFKR